MGRKIKNRPTAAPDPRPPSRSRARASASSGRCSQEGGRADVYLDGKQGGRDRRLDPGPRTHDNDYWHVTGLRAGEHTVRIVTLPDRDARSTGTQIAIQRAIVYGK